MLFEQGDASDCLYILVEGQLRAILLTNEGKQKIVGTIEKGETVGELGALSNQPRSLSVRASVDSRLLKLPHKEFEKFCKEQPAFVSRIIDLIINRSQNTLKLLSQKKLYKHIAIIQGNDYTHLPPFLTKLKDNFINHPTIVFAENISEDASLADFIDESEQKNKTVIFVLDKNNISDMQSKLNHIGGIFVVVDGDIPTQLSEFALSLLSRHQTPFATQFELALLHDDHVEKPHDTLYWLKQADFTLHHHVHRNSNEGYQRLARFMTGKTIGLIIGGGGNKGWVGMGALKAILEAGIPIDAVGGTSIGAMVGATYATTLDYEKVTNDLGSLC